MSTHPSFSSFAPRRESSRQDTMPVLAMVQDHLSYSRLLLTDMLPARVVTALLGPSIDNMSPRSSAAPAAASDRHRSIDLRLFPSSLGKSGRQDAAVDRRHSWPLPSLEEHAVPVQEPASDRGTGSQLPRPPADSATPCRDQPLRLAGLQAPATAAAAGDPPRSIDPVQQSPAAAAAAAPSPPKRLQSLPGYLMFSGAFGSVGSRAAQPTADAPQRCLSLPGTAPRVLGPATHSMSTLGTPSDSRQSTPAFEEHACVTVFFSDVCGFSTWAHQLHPSVVMGTLNDLYSRLV